MPITEIDDKNAGLLDTPGKTILLEFYNDRCPACRAVKDAVAQFAGEQGDDTMVCTVNTDKSPGLCRRYNIMSVPTFLVLRDGRVLNQKVGIVGLDELRRLVLSGAAVT
ncbi:MAG: thioredoxin family protein [Clostridiales bacterium]|nr:thioredoxin family protein [Clostridiales bacterium]HOA84427.1 thioredoxin family protein [Bacillota bacterium]